MKRLTFPLFAALALPTAVNAESYYLLVTFGGDRNFTVPMESLEQCEEQLAKVSNMKKKTQSKMKKVQDMIVASVHLPGQPGCLAAGAGLQGAVDPRVVLR